MCKTHRPPCQVCITESRAMRMLQLAIVISACQLISGQTSYNPCMTPRKELLGFTVKTSDVVVGERGDTVRLECIFTTATVRPWSVRWRTRCKSHPHNFMFFAYTSRNNQQECIIMSGWTKTDCQRYQRDRASLIVTDFSIKDEGERCCDIRAALTFKESCFNVYFKDFNPNALTCRDKFNVQIKNGSTITVEQLVRIWCRYDGIYPSADLVTYSVNGTGYAKMLKNTSHVGATLGADKRFSMETSLNEEFLENTTLSVQVEAQFMFSKLLFNVQVVNSILNCPPPGACNHGTCKELYDGYSCTCTFGYTGLHCETNIDDCLHHGPFADCSKHGECVDGIGDYNCTCDNKYYGKDCENYDNCPAYPCSGNGVCVDLVEDFRCDCKPGWKGIECESVNDCSMMNCGPFGRCVMPEVKCECDDGYYGKTCEYRDDCPTNNTCSGRGICKDMLNDYDCKCDDGYTGKDCELIDDCAIGDRILCSRRGKCLDLEGDYHCECINHAFGKDCQYVFKVCAEIAGTNDLWLDFKGQTKKAIITCQCNTSVVINGSVLFIMKEDNDKNFPCNMRGSSCVTEIMVNASHNTKNVTCKAIINDLTFTAKNISMNIQYPASRVTMLQSLPSKTKLGETEEIACMTDSANPIPTIHWRRNGRIITKEEAANLDLEIKHSSRAGSYNSFHRISELGLMVTRALAGSTFDCVVGNYQIVSVNTTLMLQVAMQITGMETPVHSGVGETLSLECSVQGWDSGLLFSWTFTKENEDIPSRFKHGPLFSIENVTEYDSGTYSCNVTGQGVSAAKTVTVEIIVPENKLPGSTLPQVKLITKLSAGVVGGGVALIIIIIGVVSFAYVYVKYNEKLPDWMKPKREKELIQLDKLFPMQNQDVPNKQVTQSADI